MWMVMRRRRSGRSISMEKSEGPEVYLDVTLSAFARRWLG